MCNPGEEKFRIPARVEIALSGKNENKKGTKEVEGIRREADTEVQNGTKQENEAGLRIPKSKPHAHSAIWCDVETQQDHLSN